MEVVCACAFYSIAASMLCVMDQAVEAGRIRKKKIDVYTDVFVCIRLLKKKKEIRIRLALKCSMHSVSVKFTLDGNQWCNGKQPTKQQQQQ